MFAAVDMDGSGELDYREFLSALRVNISGAGSPGLKNVVVGQVSLLLCPRADCVCHPFLVGHARRSPACCTPSTQSCRPCLPKRMWTAGGNGGSGLSPRFNSLVRSPPPRSGFVLLEEVRAALHSLVTRTAASMTTAQVRSAMCVVCVPLQLCVVFACGARWTTS